MTNYMDMLAAYGVTEARPGGKKMTEKIISLFPINRGDKMLDLGCGLGDTAKLLSECKNSEVVAIDVHPKMITKGKKRYEKIKNITWVNKDFLYANYPASYFHRIFAESVLSFTVVNESLPVIHNSLKENGYLFALEPVYLGGLDSEKFNNYMTFYGFKSLNTEEEWLKKFTSHSFKIEKILRSEDIFGGVPEENFPELVMDEQLDEKYISIMEKHIHYSENYLGYFDFAYFVLKK